MMKNTIQDHFKKMTFIAFFSWDSSFMLKPCKILLSWMMKFKFWEIPTFKHFIMAIIFYFFFHGVWWRRENGRSLLQTSHDYLLCGCLALFWSRSYGLSLASFIYFYSQCLPHLSFLIEFFALGTCLFQESSVFFTQSIVKSSFILQMRKMFSIFSLAF